jgi:hypothetical protein
MEGWWTDEKDWEQDLSWKNFRRWFDYEIASLPFDLGKYSPDWDDGFESLD